MAKQYFRNTGERKTEREREREREMGGRYIESQRQKQEDRQASRRECKTRKGQQNKCFDWGMFPLFHICSPFLPSTSLSWSVTDTDCSATAGSCPEADGASAASGMTGPPVSGWPCRATGSMSAVDGDVGVAAEGSKGCWPKMTKTFFVSLQTFFEGLSILFYYLIR